MILYVMIILFLFLHLTFRANLSILMSLFLSVSYFHTSLTYNIHAFDDLSGCYFYMSVVWHVSQLKVNFYSLVLIALFGTHLKTDFHIALIKVLNCYH